jgi:hypothetical protein
MAARLRTFVVSVYDEDGAVLENVSTHERMRVGELSDLGEHIEHWLRDADVPGAGVIGEGTSGLGSAGPGGPRSPTQGSST